MKSFKSVLPFILGLLLLGVSSCEYTHLDGSPLTLEEAIEKSKKIWNQYDIVFAMKDVIDPGTTFHLAFSANGKYQEISPDYDAWLIYADTNPHANGGIHYLWIFVNCKTGKMETINTSSEPYPDWEEERLINRAIPVKVTDEYKK